MKSEEEFFYGFACTMKGDMNIKFEFRDDKTFVTGKINSLDASDFLFFPGTVKEIDISEFTSRWN